MDGEGWSGAVAVCMCGGAAGVWKRGGACKGPKTGKHNPPQKEQTSQLHAASPTLRPRSIHHTNGNPVQPCATLCNLCYCLQSAWGRGPRKRRGSSPAFLLALHLPSCTTAAPPHLFFCLQSEGRAPHQVQLVHGLCVHSSAVVDGLQAGASAKKGFGGWMTVRSRVGLARGGVCVHASAHSAWTAGKKNKRQGGARRGLGVLGWFGWSGVLGCRGVSLCAPE